MTVYKTAYQTFACNGAVTRKTTEALQIALIQGSLTALPGNGNLPAIYQVEGGSTVSDAVPAFAHPFLFDDSHKKPTLSMDARSFGAIHQGSREFAVRNETEYRLALRRAQLNQVWLHQDPAILRNISAVPLTVFANWVSESARRTFALEAHEQMQIMILAGVYYCSLFTDEDEMSENSKLAIVSTLTRTLRVTAQSVLDVLDAIPMMTGVESFCQHCQTVTGSVRLKNLNVGTLYAMLGGSWWGTNAKEMVAVALEHPPTWIAILMAAFTERGYKKSAITQLVERPGIAKMGPDFMRSVLNLITVAVG